MKKLSTENLNLLPNPEELKKMCKSISALEAMICPEWEYRYYSYQKNWSETEEVFEMRNGQGDHMLIIFCKDGTCINGFAHESEMNGWKNTPMVRKKTFWKKYFGSKDKIRTELVQQIPSGVVDGLPSVFHEFIFGEPVKSIGTTFCVWQTKADNYWHKGKINLPEDDCKDGSAGLFNILDGDPATYKNWAEAYYEDNFDENELNLKLVEQIYNGVIITSDLVNRINPELENFEKLKSDLDEIGYMHAF